MNLFEQGAGKFNRSIESLGEQLFHIGEEGVGFFALKGDVIFLATGLVELVKAGNKGTISGIDSLVDGGFGLA